MIKIQFVLQGVEFVVDGSVAGVDRLQSRLCLTMDEVWQKLQPLTKLGPAEDAEYPLFVHMVAPADMTLDGTMSLKEGQFATISEVPDGTMVVKEFRDAGEENPRGIHVTLYDTFNKVGGDFGSLSNNVDFQGIQIRDSNTGKDFTDEPLTLSLFYQMAERNREPAKGKGCVIHVFSQSSSASETSSDSFLASLESKEEKVGKDAKKSFEETKKKDVLKELYAEYATVWWRLALKEHSHSKTPEEDINLEPPVDDCAAASKVEECFPVWSGHLRTAFNDRVIGKSGTALVQSWNRLEKSSSMTRTPQSKDKVDKCYS